MRIIQPWTDGWSAWIPAFDADDKPNTQQIPMKPGHYAFGIRLFGYMIVVMYIGSSLTLRTELTTRIRGTRQPCQYLEHLWAWVLSNIESPDIFFTWRLEESEDPDDVADSEQEFISDNDRLVNIRGRGFNSYRAVENAEFLVRAYTGHFPVQVPRVVSEWRRWGYCYNTFWPRDYIWDSVVSTYVEGRLHGGGDYRDLEKLRRERR